MEQTALRPKPMPGQDRRAADGTPGTVRRPHAARRRERRLRPLLLGLGAGTVLVLSGVGLGTVGATVTGTSGPAGLQGRTPPQAPPATAAAVAGPGPAPAPAAASLGVEAVDARKAGATVVGVHVPGPGYSAGLIRGDVVLRFGTARVDTAADLARAVVRARPGKAVLLTVRHGSGAYQRLTVVPAVVT
ncbi:PDZ domain-containing protein [Streptomyces dangxiongensis]|uniref:PDZ domain-containing protein n=1 Tax=Streptomyces dangxiongensis TaxID=1442032 RepID=A0A3G2J958_9ACTN|nr:PDZ domain-containing protein [Streptomyces dangxiongensis]AYN38806.1 PDZ domain-containing protein [Streptomyces dangxiongensis]